MFDLASLDTRRASDDGAVMTLVHPKLGHVLTQEDGTPITITLAGTDGERFRAAKRTQQDRRLKLGRAITAADIEQEALDTYVACTIAWSGIALRGELLDCTPANARRVYGEIVWLPEQIDRFIGDRGNFLRDTPTK